LPDGFSRYHKHSRDRSGARIGIVSKATGKNSKARFSRSGQAHDDDLDVIEGKRKELTGRLQQRYGVAKDEAECEIDTWLKNV
jgi:uncharacterized protein YjbJ (UPF0337 family)